MIDIFEQPALGHIAFQTAMSMYGNTKGGIVLSAGMGVPEQVLALGDTDEELIANLLNIFEQRNRSVDLWRGFSVGHIAKQSGAEFRQADALAALDVCSKWLGDDELGFITFRGEGYELDVVLNADDYTGIETMYQMDRDQLDLAMAFRKQMTQEAEPFRSGLAAGHYVMNREDLPRLDKRLYYDSLRLVISYHGIAAAIVNEKAKCYVPFYWSPEDDINTSQVWVPTEVYFDIDIMMASIWRDACVVKERQGFAARSSGRPYKRRQRRKNDLVVRLPRLIRRTSWAGRADKQNIDDLTREAHFVRACYPKLPKGQWSSENGRLAANERAIAAGYPIPPDGRTFRSPHARGAGEVEPKRVICKGLQVAKTLLG